MNLMIVHGMFVCSSFLISVCMFIMSKALLISDIGIWACMRCPCLCLCWVWDRDYVSQLPCVRYYVFVKSSFKHTREECESKRAYVF